MTSYDRDCKVINAIELYSESKQYEEWADDE